MAAIQLTCARIGLVSGRGLAGAMRHHYPRCLAPPLMLLVMLVGNNRAIMGTCGNGFWLNVFGWGATAVMTIAMLVFVWTSL